jgi:hypothetical protein
MADDVYIKLSELETVVTALEAIIDEFENATSRSEELEAAIGDPFGNSDLRDKARDFEERWDDKRSELKDGLKGVKEHVDGVIEGVKGWDSETAIQLSGG